MARTFDYNHVWIYEDSVSLGPLATIVTEDGTQYRLWDEIKKVPKMAYTHNRGLISINLDIWNAIELWAGQDQFGGMDLHEFLTRMFGDK